MNQNQDISKRDDEWKQLVNESRSYPEELNFVQDHLHHTIYRRRRRMIVRSLVSFTAVFAFFVLLVNTNPVVAHAISKIPVINEIAEFVSFDRGLSKAAEHDCLQNVDLVDTDGEYSLHLPYVISDSRRLFLFFQLKDEVEKQWITSTIFFDIALLDGDTSEPLDGYSLSSSSFPLTSEFIEGEYYHADIRFPDSDIPRNMKLKIAAYASSIGVEENNLARRVQDASYKEELGWLLGTFEVQLELNEYLPPIVTDINREITIEGLPFHVNRIVQYPTGMELSVTFPQDEIYEVQGLELQIKDVDGNCWGSSNGVIASGPDENGEMLYFLEGDYYSDTTLQDITISGVSRIKKSEIEVTLDLNHGCMTPSDSDANIIGVVKRNGMAEVTMEIEDGVNGAYFQHEYSDSKGNEYQMDGIGFTTEFYDSKSEVQFTVVWPEDGIVYLKRWMYPTILLEEPIVVSLNSFMN